MADPVQRPRDCKGREFRIAWSDRAVVDALRDIVAEGAVDPLFCSPDDLAIVLAEIADVEADQALAEVGGHQLGISGGQLAQLGKSRTAAGRGLRDAIVDELVAERPALEQDLILAAEIIVQRRLGDVQPLGDIVERGAVITLFKEQLDGGAQHCFALFVAGAAPAFEGQPGGLTGRGGAGVHVVPWVSH